MVGSWKWELLIIASRYSYAPGAPSAAVAPGNNRTFLESAKDDRDPFYAGFVLMLVLGLRKGEVLGLTSDPALDPQGLLADHQATVTNRPHWAVLAGGRSWRCGGEGWDLRPWPVVHGCDNKGSVPRSSESVRSTRGGAGPRRASSWAIRTR